MKILQAMFAALALAAFSAMSFGQSAARQADNYPSKPIRLVVAFAPSGVSDIIGRTLAAAMSESLGQTMIVDNRPGASGSIGAAAVAASAPDGYTLLLPSLSTVAISPNFLSRVPYDPVNDFTAIGGVATTPNILVVNSSLPVRSIGELISYAKGEGKNKLTFASSGTGSTGHLSGEVLRAATGVEMEHVSYKASALAFPDVIAGRVSMVFDSLPSTMSYIRNGNVRPIAVMADKRSPLLPEVPTFAESGFPAATLLFWLGLEGPANMPEAIVQKLNAALKKALSTPGLRERFATLGADPLPISPQEFAELRRRDVAKVKKVIKDAGIRPE
jgi:tripartite-type tricarboxylate transporter receptor subunit TctC